MTSKGIGSWGLAVAVVTLWLVGCDPTYTARLSDGGGLVVGSPVMVAQVAVGEVRSVRVVEGQVEVEIRVEREHELSMRVDTCAVPVQSPAGPALALSMGVGEMLDEPRAIPQCQPPANQMGDFLRQLGQGMGDLLRSFGQGLQNPPSRPTRPPSSQPASSQSPPSQPAPQPPVPRPAPAPVAPPAAPSQPSPSPSPALPPPPDRAI